jgi:two-component sensor histidine kinase/ligand-binding sensor domain-containing protein
VLLLAALGLAACRPAADPAPAPALAPAPPPALDGPLDELLLDTWTLADGLPQNTVTALAQTDDGYLWLGTQEGAVRYNGHAFVRFDQTLWDAFAPSQVVERLTPDGERLLVGTLQGLVEIGPDGATRALPDTLGAMRILEVERGPDGALWVGTPEGLLRCGAADCVRIGLPGDSLGRVQSLLVAADGGVWAGTEAGLLHVRPGAADAPPAVERIAEGLPDPSVLSLAEAQGGGIWAGTAAGAARVRGGRAEPQAGDGWPAGPIFALVEDRAGALWMGTDGQVVRVRDGRAEALGAAEGLPGGSRVGALAFDREGALWIGTDGGGLARLHRGAFAAVTPQRGGLTAPHTLTVHEDPRGRLWAGTDDGALHQIGPDGAARVERTFARGVAAAASTGGTLWVGTLGNGLHARLGADRWRRLATADGLPSEVVTALHAGPSGALWAGTDGGVARLAGTPAAPEITVLTRADGLPSDVVTTVLEARDGALWVGTYDGGLAVRRDGRWTVVGADVLGTPVVSALYEDDERTLWVGTFGGGLVRIPGGDVARAARITPREGLFDVNVYQILDDGAGGLWMGSNQGVFRVAREALAAVAEGRAGRVVSVAYDENDGLPSREINGGTQPAGWRAADGRLWFPTVAGLAVVDPASLRAARPAPPVVIEEVRVDGLPMALRPGEALRLPAGSDRLELDFAALALTDPSAVRYRYRLVGDEDDWSAPLDRRTASYTHLEPGDYTFRVVARNEDGVWNEQGAALRVTLLPFFWQTGWFWTLAALAGLALGTAGYRWRIRTLTDQRRRLEAEVAARTAELREALGEKEVLLREVYHRVKNNLQIIASLLSLQAAKTPDAASQTTLREARARVVSMAGVHERLYQADRLAALDAGAYVRDVAEEQFRSFNVAEGVRLDLRTEPGLLTPEQAIPLGLITNELLSNALKHAFPPGADGQPAAGVLRVHLRRADGRFHLAVEDDGPGVPPGVEPGSGTSLGLVLVRSLAARLGGDLHVGPAAHAPSGARFELSFPAPPDDA